MTMTPNALLRSGWMWIAALWLATMIHVDWHLGRSGHDHRSFDLAHHWLLAIPAFLAVGWLVWRKWPATAWRAAALIVLLGLLAGQGLEPLSETVLFGVGLEPFTSAERWRVLAEFMTAGLVTLLGALALGRWLPRSRQRF